MQEPDQASKKIFVPFVLIHTDSHRISGFTTSHGMEEGKGERYLASGRQYGNALLGVRHQEEEYWYDFLLMESQSLSP